MKQSHIDAVRRGQLREQNRDEIQRIRLRTSLPLVDPAIAKGDPYKAAQEYLNGSREFAGWMRPYVAELVSRARKLRLAAAGNKQGKAPAGRPAKVEEVAPLPPEPPNTPGQLEAIFRVVCGGPCHCVRIIRYRGRSTVVAALRSQGWRELIEHGWTCPVCQQRIRFEKDRKRDEERIEKDLDRALQIAQAGQE